jgi:hypothetical protein
MSGMFFELGILLVSGVWFLVSGVWCRERHNPQIRMKLQTNGVTVQSIGQRSSLRAKRSNPSEKPLVRDCFGEDASQ